MAEQRNKFHQLLALHSLASDEDLCADLRKGAVRKAEVFSWDSVIDGLYGNISKIVKQLRWDLARANRIS